MNNLIEIKLQVTALQLAAIAQVMNGETPVTETPPPTTSEVNTETQTPPPPVADEKNVASEAFAATTETPPPTTSEVNTETQTPPPPAGVELAKGMNGQMIPWDARIHGAAKKTNADGTWRLKQGVDREAFVPQVEAELLAAQQASPAVETQTPPPPAASETTTETQTPPPPATSEATTETQTPPPPAAAGKPTTFAELLPLVTAAKANGTLTDEKIAEASSALGLAQFGLIATRPDLIPQMVEKLGV